ncbi:helix-turn-helix domain-containing protein, partial [Streptomyces nigra]
MLTVLSLGGGSRRGIRSSARSWRSLTESARPRQDSAPEAFAERGYHATTTRDIAGRAGMSPA